MSGVKLKEGEGMIYTLDKETLNKSINNLYYVKGIIAGLTNLNLLPISTGPQIQDIINMLVNMRDCEVHVEEGDD
jgi:hypothetical protein